MESSLSDDTAPTAQGTEDRFFLYIDILNFGAIVAQDGLVEEIYAIIDRLNVHRHDMFTTIVFSDTILVYNKHDPRSLFDVNYIVMYLCEFAQDLFYRLIGRDIHFRGYITHGPFAHYPLHNIKEVFYGKVLVEAYLAEKAIQSTGLFMNNAVVPYSDIFKTRPFNKDCHFVYIMQSLGRMRYRRKEYPINPMLIVPTDEIWQLAFDIRYLATIYKHKGDLSLSNRVRRKYASAWRMLLLQHRVFLSVLSDSGFDPAAISSCDWSEPMSRVGNESGAFR